MTAGVMSLSARRAWIEIVQQNNQVEQLKVALRKESVDRNLASLSAVLTELVALRKESVDRNAERLCNTLKHLCRSPQGERG